MKKRMLPLLAPTLLLLAALLAGCNKDETDANRLPEGKHPLTLTATVQGLTATRATPDGSWDGTEKVAVIIDNETVQEYTVAADGKLTAPSDVTPYYWQNATETKSVLAWVPYSDTKPTTFTVLEDQSSSDGYAQSDMLWSSKTISYGNSTLTFKHLPAKVVVNLKKGEGVTESEVATATVTLVNQNLTSGTIGDNWSVEQVASSSGEIETNALTTATSGFHKTVQALVVPQQMQGNQFIKVTIAGGDYYYTPKGDTDANLGSGKQHTYNITVKKSGITVTASGATDWTETTSDVTSKIFKQGFSAADLKIGDFYYSDGATSDGGYREYTDGTKTTLPIMPVLTGASDESRTVVGIVYWVGDPTENDPLLARDKSGCTHGLVVALHEAKNSSTSTAGKMNWSNSYEQVNDWTNYADESENKVNITVRDKMQGYANTVALKAYNESLNVWNNTDLKVLPIAAIEQYQKDYPAPLNSSGWYLPSIMELKYMCWGQGNSQSTTGRELLNTQFAKAGGTSLNAWYYWSSSEYDPNPAYFAWVVDFRGGNVDYDSKNNDFFVRGVLAF